MKGGIKKADYKDPELTSSQDTAKLQQCTEWLPMQMIYRQAEKSLHHQRYKNKESQWDG